MSKEIQYARLICISRLRGKKFVDKSFSLDCICSIKHAPSRLLRDLFLVLDEIRGGQRWTINERYGVLFRLAAFIKLTFKDPSLGFDLIFNRHVFTFLPKERCTAHSLIVNGVKSIWYSRSSATIGFPWPRETYVNSLNLCRDKNLEILVFSYNPKLMEGFVEDQLSVESKVQSGIYVKLQKTQGSENKFDALGAWKSTQFFLYRDAGIIHGMFLMNDNLYVESDLSFDWNSFPKRFSTCGLWTDSAFGTGKHLLTMPFNEETYTDKIVLFISANLNIYHFLAESLRPLIFVLEEDIYIEAIAVRDDLPESFYAIINWLVPYVKIIRLGKNSRFSAKSIIASIMNHRLSSNASMFTSIDDDFKEDEWKVFAYLREKQTYIRDSNKILYMPRERYESRGIVNNSQIEKMILRKHGTITSPTILDWDSQLKNFESSKVFISAGGASLTNAIFLPRNSTLIELTYPWGHNWRRMSIFCGLRYINVPLKNSAPGRLGVFLDLYKANVRELERVILSLY